MPADIRFEAGWEARILSMGEPALNEAAAIVEEGQRQRIPVSRDGSHGRPAGYARSRIHTSRGRDAQGPYRDVGSDATTPDGFPYPLALELGTRPHTITSHGDYPLRAKDGRVFGKTVQHPGNPPMPWCRAALAYIAGRVFR
jgi:hypothetical protein